MLYNVNAPKANEADMSPSNARSTVQKMPNSTAKPLIQVQILLIVDKDKRYQVVSHDNL
jgi:hypothetical protein